MEILNKPVILVVIAVACILALIILAAITIEALTIPLFP